MSVLNRSSSGSDPFQVLLSAGFWPIRAAVHINNDSFFSQHQNFSQNLELVLDRTDSSTRSRLGWRGGGGTSATCSSHDEDDED